MNYYVPAPIQYAVAAAIAVILLIAPIHDVEEVETYYTKDELTYRGLSFAETQVRRFCFPWFCDKTEVQYVFQNTSNATGDFVVRIHFFNDFSQATETLKSSVAPGDQASVTVVSPLKGRSQFKVDVVPPVVSVPHERTVTKRVNTFVKLYDLLRHGQR